LTISPTIPANELTSDLIMFAENSDMVFCNSRNKIKAKIDREKIKIILELASDITRVLSSVDEFFLRRWS
jgi:hypothetical protein